MPYDMGRIESLGKRRSRLLAQLADVDAEIKIELVEARSAPKAGRPSLERLAAAAGVTRLTVDKWVKDAMAEDGEPQTL